MRALVISGSEWDRMARSENVNALFDFEIAERKCSCGQHASAVRTVGLQFALRNGFSFSSVRFLSGTVTSLVSRDAPLGDCANDIGLREIGCSESDVVGSVDARVSSSFLKKSAVSKSVEACRSAGSVWSNKSDVFGISEIDRSAFAKLGQCEKSMKLKRTVGLMCLVMARRADRARNVRFYLQ